MTNLLRHIQAIVLLPVVVLVVIPWLLIALSADLHWFDLITYPPSKWILGLFFGILGSFLFLSTIRLFIQKGKGTLAPWDPPTRLVITGPYRWIRNPMISGVFFMLLSEAILLENEFILIWAGLFFLVNHLYFVLKEEPDLTRRFGPEYLDYKKGVPRWFPRFRP